MFDLGVQGNGQMHRVIHRGRQGGSRDQIGVEFLCLGEGRRRESSRFRRVGEANVAELGKDILSLVGKKGKEVHHVRSTERILYRSRGKR